MELHPAIYNDRTRSRQRSGSAGDDALAELDDVDLKELLLDDDLLVAGGGLGASASRGARTASIDPRRADGGALASISAPIHALRNFFFPAQPERDRDRDQDDDGASASSSSSRVGLLGPTSFSPFAFTGVPLSAADHGDAGAGPTAAQPGRKRMAVDRDGRRSPVFAGFSAEDSMPYAALMGAAADGWANSLPPLEPPPLRHAAGIDGGRAAAPRASAGSDAGGGSSSSGAVLASTGSSGAMTSFAPEDLVKSELLDAASTPEDLLRALNQTFIQTSETASRRRQELRRAMQRAEKLEEPPPEGGHYGEPHERRRENHASVERRRRDNINECIAEFARMVPDLQESSKLNKGLILRKAVEYLEQVLQTNADLDEQLHHAEEQWRASYRRAELMTAQVDVALRRIRELTAQNEAYQQWGRSGAMAGVGAPPAADVHAGEPSPLPSMAMNAAPLGAPPLDHVDVMLGALTPTAAQSRSRSRSEAHSPALDASTADGMHMADSFGMHVDADAAFFADDTAGPPPWAT